MVVSSDKIRKYQIRLGWIFVASSILIVLSIVFFWFFTMQQANNGQPDGVPMASVTLVPFLALLVSITSLIGFVLTTILSVRKESREVKNFKLDIEKKSLEIEQLRLELENA